MKLRVGQWCRSCDADVVWVHTAANGKRMLVDAEPTADGTLRLTPRGPGESPLAEVLSAEARETYTHPLYRSHFATCARANEHRNRS